MHGGRSFAAGPLASRALTILLVAVAVACGVMAVLYAVLPTHDMPGLIPDLSPAAGWPHRYRLAVVSGAFACFYGYVAFLRWHRYWHSAPSPTIGEMIIDEADGLHERVERRRPDEPEAALS